MTRDSCRRRTLPLAAALDAHSRALGACRRCGHDDRRVLPILSESRAPRMMLVGQAPGRTETIDQRPFAGRAGRTLFTWLAEAGLEEPDAREAIYIAAVTRCYPGPSPSGRGDRVPSPSEIVHCSSWLDDELRLIAPRVLIPVGRLAIDRFFGPVALADVVGLTHRVTHVGGEALAIPLPHPSGASSWIHQPGHRELLARAIGLLRREVAGMREGGRTAPGSRRVA